MSYFSGNIVIATLTLTLIDRKSSLLSVNWSVITLTLALTKKSRESDKYDLVLFYIVLVDFSYLNLFLGIDALDKKYTKIFLELYPDTEEEVDTNVNRSKDWQVGE